MNISQLPLHKAFTKRINANGMTVATDIQARAIPSVLKGGDHILISPTGSGKTAAFAWPVLEQAFKQTTRAYSPRYLIVSPTRELAQQTYQRMLEVCPEPNPINILLTIGGHSLTEQQEALLNGVDIVVTTPGRAVELSNIEALDLSNIQMWVLDEADKLMQLGFADEMTVLASQLPQQHQTLLVTATMNPELDIFIEAITKTPQRIDVTRRTAAPKIEQKVYTTDKHLKEGLLTALLDENDWKGVMIFLNARKRAEDLCNTLNEAGWTTSFLHGGRDQIYREKTMEHFIKGDIEVMVATEVAARGLDIEDLPVVINYELPVRPEEYTHRIGRTGRAGKLGHAISLVCADEIDKLRAIETQIGQVIARRELPEYAASHRVPDSVAKPNKGKKNSAKKADKIKNKTGKKQHQLPGEYHIPPPTLGGRPALNLGTISKGKTKSKKKR